MTYQLGVDLGTTYTAAAVSRDGKVEVCSLGSSNPAIPSVVLLRSDGEVLVGEIALRRGLEEPTRMAREFKRRLGDPTPLVLGGTPYGAEALMSQLLRAVVQLVTDREGSKPERIVLTHPANFGPYKLDMMREVARIAGLDLDKTAFISEPEAAAISYASRNRVEPGEVVAVYDFGGGTFDAALMQRTDSGFSLLGRPEGMERFGGIDIDAAILAHVDQSLDGAIRALDPDDVSVQNSVARLKDDCRAAKEALSSDTDTSIEVSLPGIQTRVRLTRRELEDMVRPRLKETIEALERTVRTAGLTFDKLSRILLVGGSSRMPLVAEMLQKETGRPVAIDAHPKFAIAFGAAGLGLMNPTAVAPAAAPAAPAPTPAAPAASPATPASAAHPAMPTPPAAAPTQPIVQQPAAPGGAAPAAARPPHVQAPTQQTPMQPTATQQIPAQQARAYTPPTGPAPSAPGKSKRTAIIGGAVAAALVIGVLGFVLSRGGVDSAGGSDDTTEETRRRRSDDTDPPETDVPETDAPETIAPTVAPNPNVATAAPQTAPPETAPPETVPPAPAIGPLSRDQINFALIQPGELDQSWIPQTFIDTGDEPVCGTIVTDPFIDRNGALFQRTSIGTAQGLLNMVATYADAATASAFFNESFELFKSCESFPVTADNGDVITVFLQTFSENPGNAKCQQGFSIRLDAVNATNTTASETRIFAAQLCGNSYVSGAMSVTPAVDDFPPDLLQEFEVAFNASLTKLVTLPVAP